MNITHARRAIFAVAATTLLTTACSTATYPTRESAARQHAQTKVQVTNHNWMDMTVYALRDGSRVRIGSVTSGTTERFSLPRGFDLRTGALRLEADPIG